MNNIIISKDGIQHNRKTTFRCRMALLLAGTQGYSDSIDIAPLVMTFQQWYRQSKYWKSRKGRATYLFNQKSYQLEHDIKALLKKGHLHKYQSKLKIHHEWPELDFEIYREFINSDTSKYNPKNETITRDTIDNLRRSYPDNAIFGFGYEGLDIDEYIRKLIDAGIHCVLDVRYHAASRKYGFTGGTLKMALLENGIVYYDYPHLGIPTHVRQKATTDKGKKDMLAHYGSLIKSGRQRYDNHTIGKIMTELPTPQNLDDNGIFYMHISLRLLYTLATQTRCVITCYEQDTCDCHRQYILKYLSDKCDVPVHNKLNVQTVHFKVQ